MPISATTSGRNLRPASSASRTQRASAAASSSPLSSAELTAGPQRERRRLLTFVDRRWRRHRRGNGRRHRRGRAADSGRRFPQHRSALGAHCLDRSRAAPAAELPAEPVATTCARARPRRRRGQDRHAWSRVRCKRRRSRRRPHRCGHRHLGRRRVASPAARWLNAEADRAGRVKVAPDLSVPGHPDIFVIGDTAAITDATGKPVPGIAPAAKQMGRYVGK